MTEKDFEKISRLANRLKLIELFEEPSSYEDEISPLDLIQSTFYSIEFKET